MVDMSEMFPYELDDTEAKDIELKNFNQNSLFFENQKLEDLGGFEGNDLPILTGGGLSFERISELKLAFPKPTPKPKPIPIPGLKPMHKSKSIPIPRPKPTPKPISEPELTSFPKPRPRLKQKPILEPDSKELLMNAYQTLSEIMEHMLLIINISAPSFTLGQGSFNKINRQYKKLKISVEEKNNLLEGIYERQILSMKDQEKELLEAIVIIDPYFIMQNHQSVFDKAEQLYIQLPKKNEKVDNEFIKKMQFSQQVNFNSLPDKVKGPSEEWIKKIEVKDCNIVVYISKEIIDKKDKKISNENQIVSAINESILSLDKEEKTKLKTTNTYILVHNAIGNVQQQGIWRFNQRENVHIGDIFLNEKRNNDSIAGHIRKSQGEEGENKAIVMHELGHILHAILNPTNFRLASAIDLKSDLYKTSNQCGTVVKFEKDVNNLKKWYYANTSIKEFVAEIFTALVSGEPISKEQYDWYLEHGGPRINGRDNKKDASILVELIE